MVALISGCVMMVNALSDAMLCILTVQGWVHDRAGLGARLYRAGCTGVQGWVHGLLTERRLQRHFPWAMPKRWQDLCIPP